MSDAKPFADPPIVARYVERARGSAALPAPGIDADLTALARASASCDEKRRAELVARWHRHRPDARRCRTPAPWLERPGACGSRRPTPQCGDEAADH